jgi:hypothetical protein
MVLWASAIWIPGPCPDLGGFAQQLPSLEAESTRLLKHSPSILHHFTQFYSFKLWLQNELIELPPA